VQSVNGFNGQVQLLALNLPSNIVLPGTGFSPQTINVPSGGSATSTFNYVSNTTVPTGNFTITMQGEGGSLTRNTSVTLTVNLGATPDFSVSASPVSRTINQGQSTTYTITVTSQNGFSGSVNLAALNLPGNVVIAGTSFSPQTVNVPASGSVTSTFNYVSNSTVPVGSFTVTMQGQGEGLSRSTTVTLIVNPGATPDFTVSASPSSHEIIQGQTTTYAINVTSVNGFNGPVQMFAINLPGNLVLTGTGFNPQSVNLISGGSATSTFTLVTNSQTPAGTFTISFEGRVGSTTRSTTVQVVIDQPEPFDFSISASPSTRTIAKGSSATFGVTVRGITGSGGTVSLFAIGLPADQVLPGTGFNPQSMNINPNGSVPSILTFVSNNQTPLGTFNIIIEGRSGGVSRSTTVQLVIEPPPPDSATFVRETIPDDAPPMQPGQNFTKTWTIRNSGATTWNSGYKLHWDGGSHLSNHADVAIIGTVPPGSNYTFSISMTAPATPGAYREDWRFLNPDNATITVNSSATIWVSIRVGSTCAAPVITTQPPGGDFFNGTSIMIPVWANGQPPLTYQWYQGAKGDTSHRITGATSSLYTTPRLFSTTSYWVRITSSCGTSVDSETATMTIGQTIDIVDPVCSSNVSCTGAYLTLGLRGVSLTTDVNRLATASVTRHGIVADGVTKLLLRVHSDGPVTFSISPGVGTLMKIDGSLSGSSLVVQPVTISPSERIAFALYQAPSDFPGGTSTFDVTIQANQLSKPLRIHRPPVLLVHGVWSGPGSWTDTGIVERLRDRHFDICEHCLVDYSGDPAGSFDPLESGTPLTAMMLATRSSLNDYRQVGIAITQVDVVAHSMGGLVARGYAAQTGQFVRTDNYRQGDFHKIITVGTPHLGTPMADWLIQHRHNLTRTFIPIETLFEIIGKPLGPAIEGFKTSSSAIQHIGQTNVSMATIVGVAPAVSGSEIFLNEIFRDIIGTSDRVDSILGGEGNHDLLVPVESQRGGRNPLPILGVVHSDSSSGLTDKHIAETASAEVWTEILRLLDLRVGSGAFSNSAFAKSEAEASIQSITPAVEEAFSAPSYPKFVTLAASAITPPPGTIVRAGDVVNIMFTLTGGNAVDGALFVIGDRVEIVHGSGAFALSFTVPPERAGKIDIKALTFGPGPDNYSVTTSLLVVPGLPLTSVSATPSNVLLQSVGQQFQLRVTGQVADGTTIDLTQGTAGTSYSLHSQSNRVASITTDGQIEARGFGQETVLITNAGITMTVNVTVGESSLPRIFNASVRGKKLFITGENFDSAATILLDGETQKTANDDQAPTASLIGKKAGKKISSGQTVTLMVRNSDGTLSNAFSFTRP